MIARLLSARGGEHPGSIRAGGTAIALALLAASPFSPAMAAPASTGGDDLIIMRRVIANPKSTRTQPEGYAWVAGEWSWLDDVQTCTDNAIRVRTVTCRDPNGVIAPDTACPAADRPETTGTAERFESCSFTWKVAGWSPWSAQCTEDASRTREVKCVRDGDNLAIAVPDENCRPDQRPVSAERGSNVNGCDFYWRVGEYSAWTGTCETQSTRQRTVVCADAEGNAGADEKCVGPKPASVQNGSLPTACSYSWVSGEWSDYSSQCSNEAVRKRDVSCSATGGNLLNAKVDDGECAGEGPKPEMLEKAQVFSGCTQNWAITGYGDWSSGCSAQATRAALVSCMRSDGTPLGDSACSGQERPVSEIGNYTTCQIGWVVGDWSPFNSACSTSATRTRSVDCIQTGPDFAPRAIETANCDQNTRPAASERTSVLSGCEADWTSGEWGGWSSGCSATAERTRVVQCRMTNGTVVEDEQCAARGEKPTEIETGNYSGCQNNWVPSAWGPWSNTSTCSASASRDRTASCQRSDGTPLPDEACPMPKPPLQELGNLSGCTVDWATGEWSVYDSTCSNSAKRERSVNCQRSDGQVLDDDLCSISTRPRRVETSTVLSGCSYAWEVGEFEGPEACTSAATLTRTVVCKRSDGTIEPEEGNCNGTKPASTATGASYSSCSYSWFASGLAWNSTCSPTAQQTQTVYCLRSNGDAVDDGFCSSAGAKPSAVGSAIGNMTGCSYEWEAGPWGWNGTAGAWSSECSTNAQQTRTVECVRNGEAVVAESYCQSTSKPKSSQTAYRDAQCLNKWVPDPDTGTGSTACHRGQVTIWEPFKCVNSSGAMIGSTSSSYCSKIGSGTGPLSGVQDNMLLENFACSMGAPSTSSPFSQMIYNSNALSGSAKVASGTIRLPGAPGIVSAAVQNAAKDACFAALANLPGESASYCSYAKSWSDDSYSYYDWTLRYSNIPSIDYGKASARCDIFNDGFDPGTGAVRSTNCVEAYAVNINYGSLTLYGTDAMTNKQVCGKAIAMTKTGQTPSYTIVSKTNCN